MAAWKGHKPVTEVYATTAKLRMHVRRLLLEVLPDRFSN